MFQGVRVVRSTNFPVSSGVLTKVVFEAIKWGAAAWWNVANPTRITVPYTGWYEIGGLTGWDGNATRSRQIDLFANNTTFLMELGGGWACSASVSDNPSNDGSSPVLLNAGDYFEMRAFQVAGVALNMTGEMFAFFLGLNP